MRSICKILLVSYLICAAAQSRAKTATPTFEPTEGATGDTLSPTEHPTYSPSEMPTIASTHSPSVLSTTEPSHTMVPSVSPTNASTIATYSNVPSISPLPAVVLTSTPSNLPYVLCPVFFGRQVHCSGCQFCPDGSLCNNCANSNVTNTPAPSISVTSTPTVMPSLQAPTTYQLCPLFQGKQVQCSGCQFCPDGSLCGNCVDSNVSSTPVPTVLTTLMPSVAPSPRVPTTYQLCPVFNGQQVQCSGCQFCPDGSRCANCELTAIALTVAPVAQLTDMPVTPPTTRLPYELCPANNGLVVRCSGCQYCPDGSLCTNCAK